jgi:ADP-ribosylation factor GTPase-activating protein 2/3
MNAIREEQNKKIMDNLMSLVDNMACFDCSKLFIKLEKIPAHWVSLNNSIFLCMECSGTHRSYGVNISYVRSATLNTLTNPQLKTLELGGNKRLKEFFKLHKTPCYLSKKQLYNTNLMHYYRRLVK